MERKAMTDYTADELEPVDCSGDEQEITFSAYRADDRFDIWVSDNTMLTKIKNAMKRAPEAYKLEDIVWSKEGTVAGYKFSMPKNLLRFGSPVKFSQEQIEANAARLKEYREAQKVKTE